MTGGLKVLIFLLGAAAFTSCSSSPEIKKAQRQVRQNRLISSIRVKETIPIPAAYERMIRAGISKDFADRVYSNYLAKQEDLTNRQKIINLNVYGFLGHSDYSKHYSANAVKKTRAFLKKYPKTFSYAEKKFGVPKKVIASLLWVETKLGKTTGNFELPSVYYSLLQADHPSILAATLEELDNRRDDTDKLSPKLSDEELEKKVITRSVKKAEWALEQLQALDRLYLKGFKNLLSLKSSFAGAFGYSQFIPSTFADHAFTARNAFPNLFDMQDAILSVANYLKFGGWDEKDPESKTKALFVYNRSDDYGKVILKIANDL